MKVFLPILLISIIFSGCNSDEFSPNQKFNRDTPKAVNAREIAELSEKKAGNNIKIAISGDTQRTYKESQLFVDYINSRNDVDFVILNGDISDFGLLLEFDGIYKIYNKLNVPFICVIGNHDLVANGRDIYKRMFGDLNFSFDYGGIKFVCHDTNGREYNFEGKIPDLDWLKDNFKLNNNENGIIAISHVPPTDGDFDPALSEAYQDLMNQTPGMLASIHSHQHQKETIYYQNGKGIPFIITNAIVNRGFTMLNISNGKVTTQDINF